MRLSKLDVGANHVDFGPGVANRPHSSPVSRSRQLSADALRDAFRRAESPCACRTPAREFAGRLGGFRAPASLARRRPWARR